MSRSEYSDDCDNLHLYRNSVDRAISGKRGQAFLRDLVVALDALPEKKLIAGAIVNGSNVCALGSVALKRRMAMAPLDSAIRNHDHEVLGNSFNIAQCLAREVEYMNDEYHEDCTPEQRWERMRKWAVEHLPREAAANG